MIDPDILFFSEAKFDKKRMEKFRMMLSMPHMLAKGSDGSSGRLAIFRKRSVNLSLRCMGRMHIDAYITEDDDFKWRLT